LKSLKRFRFQMIFLKWLEQKAAGPESGGDEKSWTRFLWHVMIIYCSQKKNCTSQTLLNCYV